MRKLAEYTIPFVGLKIGSHDFEYEIGKEFFEHFEYEDFNSANLHLEVVLEKKATMMELFYETSGTVNVNCDVTNEPFDMPINSSLRLVVNFGDEFNDENEELLILPHGEYEINIAQYAYEMIVLAVPQKRIHPGIEDGTLKSDVLDKLEELSPKGVNEDNDNEDDIDPRWNKLKNLLNDK
ncbi:MAG TPA: DUF177 domain-containing protein [Gillisia sp.]|nr:DUF177 domain-containing protein [Gillisia sp.]